MSAKPREITVSFFVNALKDIDAINGTVELDFILYCSWIDPDLKGISVEDRPPYDEDTRKGGDERECCWNPKIEVNNNVSLETLWSLYPPGYQGVEEGKVIWGARYRGCISNDMDLSMFPLDSDSISISIGPKDETVDKAVLKIDPAKHGFEGAPGDRIKKSNLAEWSVDVPCVRLGLSGPTGSGNYYSNVEFCIMVHRNFVYYVWKVLAIVYLLILSSFVCFAMDPIDDFGDRINICLTLFLAAVAFLYVVGENLPKVPYLTLLDKLMLIAFFFIFLAGVESLFAKNMQASHGTGNTLDAISVAAFPLAYFGLNLLFLGVGIRYRYKLINDKGGEEYQKALALDSKLKSVEVAGSGSESKQSGEKQASVAASSDKPSPAESSGSASLIATESSGLGAQIARRASSAINVLTGVSEASNELAARVQREQEEERENIKSMVLKGDVVLGDRSEGSGEGLGGVGEQAKKRRVSITASKKY